MAYYPIVQEEVDELLAKGDIESSTCGAHLYPIVLWFLSILVVYGPYSALSN